MTSDRHHRVVIANGTLLTMDDRLGDLPGADVVVDDGVITAVGAGADPGDADEVVDATGCVVIPGFVDTHRHMWQAVLRGCGPDYTLADYFTHVLGRFGRALTPDDLYLGNLLSALSAVDAGITAVQDVSNVNDAPGRPEALVAGLRDAGVRALFAFGHGAGGGLRRPAHGGVSDHAAKVRAELLPDDDDDLVRMALCVDAGSDEAAVWNWSLARDLDVPVALHCRGGGGGRPVSGLRALGVLGPRAVFIHGTGLDVDELALIADSGAALSIAPAVEMVMGHGMPPVAAALAAGLRPSLSVDVETTVAGDMFTQMRAAFQAGRFTSLHVAEDFPLVTARQVLEFATTGGAEALGLADRIGSLTPGKQADVVVLRADRPGVAPVYDPVGAVVQSMDRGDVDTVLVAGRVLKRGGRLLRDTGELVERAERVRDRLTAG